MTGKIFREKSTKKVSSPEQLDDYIKTVTPGAWITLGAIIALLAGAVVWGIFGHIDGVSPISFLLN